MLGNFYMTTTTLVSMLFDWSAMIVLIECLTIVLGVAIDQILVTILKWI